MSDKTHISEKELLAATALDDQAAFEQLYEQYRRKVYAIAWRLLQSEAEAEDVQQEVFSKIWINRSKIPGIENFNSYLNTLIRNHIYNALRKKAHETAYLRESFRMQASADPFESSDLSELQQLLHQAIRALPGQQQKVFQLVRIEGRPHAEVAELLGISRETVKKHMMEAQRAVNRFFEGHGKPLVLLLLILMTQS